MSSLPFRKQVIAEPQLQEAPQRPEPTLHPRAGTRMDRSPVRPLCEAQGPQPQQALGQVPEPPEEVEQPRAVSVGGGGRAPLDFDCSSALGVLLWDVWLGNGELTLPRVELAIK